jgi:hypothetical protein
MVPSCRVFSVLGLALALATGCGTYKPETSEFIPPAADATFGNGMIDAPILRSAITYQGPTSCDQAAMTRSYIGCDYWPTVTTNPVWEVFDFTAVVANAQGVPASITVTGPNGFSLSVSVAPGAVEKIYLPWVKALKGPQCDSCGIVPIFAESVTAPASAYHLVSSVPVTVYQFNALEYKGVGGAPGKDWGACPGSAKLCEPSSADGGADAGAPRQPAYYLGCYSYTNDASLLIPSTAMTGNYRVTTDHAIPGQEGSYFAVTAVSDATTVTVTVSSTATVIAGGTVPFTAAGGTLTLTMNSGDVVEVMSDMNSDHTDISGSLVQANNPVQVIAGTQCSTQPQGYPACDHLESSVLPAETLGKDYVVTVPTSPGGSPFGHVVRFYGNVDGTTLTYSPTRPSGCPATLAAGEVGECVDVVMDSFEVKGSHEFAVSSFQLGGSLLQSYSASPTPDGDPSMSPMVATEEYLESYIFLAPTDYDQSYIDIVAPPGTLLTLDGVTIDNPVVRVNASWNVVRAELGVGKGATVGTHVLTATNGVGVQVIGYGAYTSYQYPAGLDLTLIAPPPIK